MAIVKAVSVKDNNIRTWEEGEALARSRGESMSMFVSRLIHLEVLRVKVDRSAVKQRGDTPADLLEKAGEMLDQARDLLVRQEEVS